MYLDTTGYQSICTHAYCVLLTPDDAQLHHATSSNVLLVYKRS